MRNKMVRATLGASMVLAVLGTVSLSQVQAGGHGWGGGRHGDDRGRHGGMMGGGGMMMGGGPFSGMMLAGRLCPGSFPDRAEMETAVKADGLAWDVLAARRDACFQRFDTSKDGTIDATEIDAAVAVRATALANRALSFGDRDFDGSITREELTGGWFGWRHWFGGRGDQRREAQAPTSQPAPETGGQPPANDVAEADDMMPDMPRRGRRGRHGAHLSEMFDRADTDKNGTVSDTELKSFARLLVEDGKRLLMHRLDKDKSGTLTRVEFDQPVREMFDGFDVNGDGRVKRDELPLPMQWRLEG